MGTQKSSPNNKDRPRKLPSRTPQTIHRSRNRISRNHHHQNLQINSRRQLTDIPALARPKIRKRPARRQRLHTRPHQRLLNRPKSTASTRRISQLTTIQTQRTQRILSSTNSLLINILNRRTHTSNSINYHKLQNNSRRRFNNQRRLHNQRNRVANTKQRIRRRRIRIPPPNINRRLLRSPVRRQPPMNSQLNQPTQLRQRSQRNHSPIALKQRRRTLSRHQ